MSIIVEVKTPDFGAGSEGSLLVALHVAEGGVVVRDAPFAEIETEKSIIAMSSPVSGDIVEMVCKPGDILRVGSVMARVRTTEEAPVSSREAQNSTPMERLQSPLQRYLSTRPV